MVTSLTRKKWYYPLLAFLAPCIGMLFVMLISGYTPFGSYSMLYSDMYHQYYPFFVAFRKALLSGQSLLFNWSAGMGMDYLGLAAYYLASPLNLLSVLVPEGWLLQYFSLLVPIKLGFAGLFFALFLKGLFRKNDLSLVFFGSFYALCAWALGYQWNVMWLDTFALLPLVMLGMVRMLTERKFLLYTFCLCFSVLCNYYIGLFVCIFVLLTFFCYEICRFAGFKKLFADLFYMAVFTLLALGMTAVLELPAYAALQNTYSSVNVFPKGFRLNITDKHTLLGLFDAMRQVAGNMNGGLEPTFKEGLPNLYCGIGTNILALLFLTCKQVRLRDKLCSVLLLLFFNVSFIIRQLDYIWHGFHFTNMIPYRFSFLYSFVLLYMAYRAYLLRYRFKLWQMLTASMLAIALAFCTNDLTKITYWAYNGVFLLLYTFLFLYGYLHRRMPQGLVKKERSAFLQPLRFRRRFGGIGLFAVFTAELVLNLINFGVYFPGTPISDYPKGTQDTASAIEYMLARESDSLFYRAEATATQTLNDGALNGYNGISAFTSSANVNVTRFMKALGYSAKDNYNRYCFEESSPVANLFLNLKYMLERGGRVEQNAYFDLVHSYMHTHLLENNAYLPLGFLAHSQLVNVDFGSAGNRFVFQNELFSAATGITTDVWQMLSGATLTITGEKTEVTAQNQTGYCSYNAPEGGETVTFHYTVDKSGLMCLYLDRSRNSSYSVWKNGMELYNKNYSLPQMVSVCDVLPGDSIEIRFHCGGGENGTINVQAAVLQESVFRAGYEILNTSTLELTEFSTTQVSGTVNCDRAGVLYTSIPQDGNWVAYVDGKQTQTVTIGDAMVGLILSEGFHTVQLRYENRAFSLGWKISCVCLVCVLGIGWYKYRPSFKKRRGKYEK